MCRDGSDNAENLGVVRTTLEAVAQGAPVDKAYRRLCFVLSGCVVRFPARQKPFLRELICRMLNEGIPEPVVVEKVGCTRRYVRRCAVQIINRSYHVN